MQVGELTCSREVSERGRHGRTALERLAPMVGIVDRLDECQPLFAPRRGLTESAPLERGLAPSAECERPQLDVVERSGSFTHLVEHRVRGLSRLDVDERQQSPEHRPRVRSRSRALTAPTVDPLPVETDREHRRPDRRLEREKRIRVRPLRVVERSVERTRERRLHPVCVVAQRVHLAEEAQDPRPLVVIGRELRRAAEQLDCLVQLVPRPAPARRRGAATARPCARAAEVRRARPPMTRSAFSGLPPASSGTRGATPAHPSPAHCSRATPQASRGAALAALSGSCRTRPHASARA